MTRTLGVVFLSATIAWSGIGAAQQIPYQTRPAGAAATMPSRSTAATVSGSGDEQLTLVRTANSHGVGPMVSGPGDNLCRWNFGSWEAKTVGTTCPQGR